MARNPKLQQSSEDEQAWLQNVLTRDIPLGGAMDLRVVRLDAEGVALAFPLGPNINDKGTAFGGAMASAMIMAGWSLPRLILKRNGLKADLVIGRCEMRFLIPVSGDYQAHCSWPNQEKVDQFASKLRDRGRAGVTLNPRIVAGDQVAATLSARYAALGDSA